MHALHINDWIRKSYDGKLFTRRFLYHGKMRVMDTSNRDWRISCALAVQNCVMAPRQYSRSLNAPLMLARRLRGADVRVLREGVQIYV